MANFQLLPTVFHYNKKKIIHVFSKIQVALSQDEARSVHRILPDFMRLEGSILFGISGPSSALSSVCPNRHIRKPNTHIVRHKSSFFNATSSTFFCHFWRLFTGSVGGGPSDGTCIQPRLSQGAPRDPHLRPKRAHREAGQTTENKVEKQENVKSQTLYRTATP